MVYPSQGYRCIISFYSRADSPHHNMPSRHWDRILIAVACCVVTLTLWSLCAWQLIIKFHTGKKYNSALFELCLSSLRSSVFPKVFKHDY